MFPKRFVLGLAAAGIASPALAQQPPINLPIPNGPGVVPQVFAPAPPPPNALGIAPRPALPTQNTLASFLGVSADQREFRGRRLATTPGGQVLGRMQAPFSRLSGGIIPPLIPKTPSLAELQDPGPIGAAAKIKQDRAGAEARKKAVEYLGTADCNTWPEAEDALVGALRADRNECVRLAAAQVLGKGCCCTKKTIKALTLSASGSDCDGNPGEKSSRVRAAAQLALEHCLCCFLEVESNCPDKNCDKKPDAFPPLAPLPKPGGKTEDGPELPPAKKETGSLTPEAYYKQVAKTPAAEIVAEARKALIVPIPVEDAASPVSRLDEEAAGLPTSDDATARSPRPASLLDLFTRSDPRPGATPVPVRAMGGTAVALATRVEKAPVKAVPMAAKPTPVAVKPIMSTPTTTAPWPAPGVVPASSAVPAGATGSRAERVSRMFKSVCPIPELVGAIDQLTVEDLRATPGLVPELVAAGTRCSAAPVRLATVKALVRCHASTPDATGAIKQLAQADPDLSVRAAAAAGMYGRP